LSKLSRILPLALNAIILLFTFLVAYSALSLDIEPPTDISWDVEDQVLYMTANFSVKNGGLFDIENIFIRVTIKNSSGYLISSKKIYLGDIPKGTVRRENITVSINLTELLMSELRFNLFRDDIFLVNISVIGGYAKFFGFELSIPQAMEWKAPLKGLDMKIGGVGFSSEGLEIKVDIHHEGWATFSNIPVRILIEILGDGRAESDDVIPEIGMGRNRIPLRVNLTEDMARTLLLEDRDLRINVETPVINISKDVKWRALISNLSVERVGYAAYGAYSRVDFRISFENKGLCDLETIFVISLLDVNRQEVARKELNVFAPSSGYYSKVIGFTILSKKAAKLAFFCIEISDPALVRFEIPLG